MLNQLKRHLSLTNFTNGFYLKVINIQNKLNFIMVLKNYAVETATGSL